MKSRANAAATSMWRLPPAPEIHHLAVTISRPPPWSPIAHSKQSQQRSSACPAFAFLVQGIAFTLRFILDRTQLAKDPFIIFVQVHSKAAETRQHLTLPSLIEQLLKAFFDGIEFCWQEFFWLEVGKSRRRYTKCDD
jgi:hypothetical protein